MFRNAFNFLKPEAVDIYNVSRMSFMFSPVTCLFIDRCDHLETHWAESEENIGFGLFF